MQTLSKYSINIRVYVWLPSQYCLSLSAWRATTGHILWPLGSRFLGPLLQSFWLHLLFTTAIETTSRVYQYYLSVRIFCFNFSNLLFYSKSTEFVTECYIQGVSKGSLQNFRGYRAHHKDSELHRNPCPQTSFLTLYEPCVLVYFQEMWTWLLNAESLTYYNIYFNIFIVTCLHKILYRLKMMFSNRYI